jgi:hypothetical protein
MLGFDFPKLTKPVRDVRLHKWFEGGVLFHDVVSCLSFNLAGSWPRNAASCWEPKFKVTAKFKVTDTLMEIDLDGLVFGA